MSAGKIALFIPQVEDSENPGSIEWAALLGQMRTKTPEHST